MRRYVRRERRATAEIFGWGCYQLLRCKRHGTQKTTIEMENLKQWGTKVNTTRDNQQIWYESYTLYMCT